MDTQREHFGSYLRRQREACGVPLSDVARVTKITPRSLKSLEASDLETLPAEVFVRGFIRSYCRHIHVEESEPLLLYYEAVREDERARAPVETVVGPELAQGIHGRRRLSVAVLVAILVIVTTLTLSLLLKRPGSSGASISSWAPLATDTEADNRADGDRGERV